MGPLGPIGIGHIGRIGPISQTDEPLQIRITNSLLSGCRKDDSMVLHSCGNSLCCWTFRWLFHCPSRFSTRRCLSNYVHPRPGSVAWNVSVCANGYLRRHRVGVQCTTGVDDGLINLDNRSDVYVSFVSNWRLLGQANLGYVVGVGCANDLNVDPHVPLYRLYFIAIIN